MAPTLRRRTRRPALARSIRAAGVRTYADTGDTRAYVEWTDGSSTEGRADNPHMQALLTRARREGVNIKFGEVLR